MNLMNGEQREHPATRFASRSAERIPRCPAPFDGSDKSGRQCGEVRRWPIATVPNLGFCQKLFERGDSLLVRGKVFRDAFVKMRSAFVEFVRRGIVADSGDLPHFRNPSVGFRGIIGNCCLNCANISFWLKESSSTKPRPSRRASPPASSLHRSPACLW